MKIGIVEVYLLGINVLGFIVGLVNSKVRSKKEEGKSDIILAVFSILGGQYAFKSDNGVPCCNRNNCIPHL